MKFKLSLIVVAFLAFAIMGSTRGAYAAPPANACSLLTSAQVNAVLGVPAAGKALMPTVCIWHGASGKAVRLNLINPQAFASAKFGVGMRLDYGLVKTEVKGIGDDAVYVSENHADTTLTVKKGTAAFTLFVSGFSDDLNKAKEKTLAIEVCSKL